MHFGKSLIMLSSFAALGTAMATSHTNNMEKRVVKKVQTNHSKPGSSSDTSSTTSSSSGGLSPSGDVSIKYSIPKTEHK
jgi:hypothetical protein